MNITNRQSNQKGTSMVEFLVVMPMLLFTGLAIMQLGLVYHAKTVLNYATFEAARAGAVSNGQIEVMRKELGYRLAPIYGGDGGTTRAAMSLVRSMVAVNDISATKIEIISPEPSAFGVHGINKTVTDRHGHDIPNVTAIPNSHLRFAPAGIQSDGLNLHDANLLKIQVTYGYQMRLPFLNMKVPGLRWIMRNFLIYADQDNWMYYVRGMLPIKATATVRMQSEAWDHQEDPPIQRLFEAVYNWVEDQLRNDDEDNDGVPNECDSNPSDANVNATNGLTAQQQNVETVDPNAINCNLQTQFLPARDPQDCQPTG